MNKYKIYALIHVFLMISCGSLKTTEEDSKPDWIISRPISEINYVGIGMASKERNPFDYMSISRNNALSDLSSEISVNLYTSSILNSLETSNNFTENYTSSIRLKTQKELKGYKLVSTYETDKVFWRYYILNKEFYNKQLEQKKARATKKSYDYYIKSKQEYDISNMKTAMLYNIKAIESIKNYWNEEVVYSENGETIFLGNELISNLNNIIKELSITSLEKNITVVRSKPLTKDVVTFNIESRNKVKQVGIPVVILCSEHNTEQYKMLSNIRGDIPFYIDRVTTKKSSASISCMVDIDAVISEASNDFMLKKLLSGVYTPRYEVLLNVKSPKIFITSKENILGADTENNILGESLYDFFSNKGYKMLSTRDSSDFVIEIKSNTDRLAKNGRGIFSSELKSSIILYSAGNKIYSTKMAKIIGRGNSFISASKNAYLKAEDELTIKVANQIYRIINKK